MRKPASAPHWLLRRSDQKTIAALVLLAVAAIAGWRLAYGGSHGRLVEFDDAEPLSARFEVDVNAADLPELLLLPGVGPKLAQRILDLRNSSGPFHSADDLRRVKGIGPKKLEQLRPCLRFESDVENNAEKAAHAPSGREP